MNIFKRKSNPEPELQEPYEYWKDPRLDDEGTYDYLVEELPKDKAYWDFDRYKCRCESCGKEHMLVFRSEHYFYCWDGYDSMSYDECWVCVLKRKIASIKHRAKRKIKATFDATKWCLEKKSFKNFKLIYQITVK